MKYTACGVVNVLSVGVFKCRLDNGMVGTLEDGWLG